ncbi:MAG: AAA family ATPase [Bacteroidia bacterium]|nr:AAA family ATPase [Bacteroidia bacterium]MCX7652683.1 AAA family ATPase [Bacteroidia bacterium]MDW8416963.1 AAA family ATPase [Bacteroidia bacterium]
MRLRALELRGFKSFAEAVKLPLDARLIGIVGPNGCGKSNIADALRWIMGEQKNRLLRIEKADNLIFNGSQRRKPLPFAEVTLEVEDFSPELPRLTFTRRVYRTGESEYFLNNTPARLKDFLNYFWQVGLSPQSILDGGQVEALIQDRGGARRALIESLAGIERYHHHKKELLAELEKTQSALSQIENLLTELRQQIKTLTSQAEKVATYQKLKQAYRELLSAWISQELAAIAKAEAQHSEQNHTQEETFKVLRLEIEQLELRIQALEERYASLEDTSVEAAYETLRTEYQTILREESRFSERLKHLERQEREISEEKALRHRQREELHTEEQTFRQKQEALSTSYNEKQALLTTISSQLQTIQADLRKLESQARERAEQQRQLETEQRRLLNSRQTLEATMRPLVERLQQVEREQDSLQNALHTLTQERETNTEKLKALQQEFQTLQQHLQALTAYHSVLVREKDNLRQRLHQLQARLQGLKSQREGLEALLARNDGWPTYLIKLRELGIQFWRTEDIFFAEEEELPYLSLLLRIELPTLWVTNPSDAEVIHQFLQDKKEGIFAVRLYQPSKTQAGPAWLSKFQTLEGFEGLAEYLWGDVGWEGEAKPRQLSANRREMRLPDGRLYFLSETPTQHIGLPHRIRKLQVEEKRLSQHVAILRQEIGTIEQVLARLPLQAYRQKLETTRKATAQAEKDLSAVQIRLEETQKRQQALLQDAHQLTQKQAQITAELNALKPAIENIQQQLVALTAENDTLHQQTSALHQQYGQLQKTHQELRFAIVQIENELKSTENAQKLTLQQLNEVQKRLRTLAEKEASLKEELLRTQRELQILAERKLTLEPQIQNLSERLSSFRQQKKEIEAQLSTLRKDLSEKQHKKDSLQSAIARYEARQAELSQRKALLLQRLSVELELTPESLPAPPSQRLKSEEVERQLQRIKEQIAHLGELNFEAAATLESLIQRETEIVREKTDIEHTFSNLKQLLGSLDKEAQEKFLSTFEAVRQRFIQLFQGLFAEGDTCDMVLLHPQSPLTSEIEIIARPKGKRPISLQQLSGGEKALTALSLLFATFAVHASALCILDEADAALDDVNTHKFGQLLRRVSETTPVLVITHNKITMSYCERLYGVTMPEPGVSTVLAVDMETKPALAKAV